MEMLFKFHITKIDGECHYLQFFSEESKMT